MIVSVKAYSYCYTHLSYSQQTDNNFKSAYPDTFLKKLLTFFNLNLNLSLDLLIK